MADVTIVSRSEATPPASEQPVGALPADGTRVRLPGGLSGIGPPDAGPHVRRSAQHGSCAADTPTSKPSHFAQLDAHTSTHGMAGPCGTSLGCRRGVGRLEASVLAQVGVSLFAPANISVDLTRSDML
jgi:hypothetical protein